MANPAPVAITEKKWIKFASAIVTGVLRQPPWNNAVSFKFYWTSRDADETAPDDDDQTDNGLSMKCFEESDTEPMSSITPQDFYIYGSTAGGNATTVLRIDL